MVSSSASVSELDKCALMISDPFSTIDHAMTI